MSILTDHAPHADRALHRGMAALLALGLSLPAVAERPRAGDAGRSELLAAAPTSAAAPKPRAAEPLRDGQRKSLREALDAALGRKALRKAKVGLVVVDLASGETLYEREGDTLFNPASVSKILTAATALRRLGPEFRFVTTVLTSEPPKGERVDGDLYVRGGGDPKLTTESMYKLASNVAARGVTKVKGDIVVDDSYFDGERKGAGWDQDKSDRPYQAPVGAASVNFNALQVRVLPGAKVGKPARVLADPATAYLRVDNEAKTVKAGARTQIKVKSVAEGDHNVLKVRGRIAADHLGWSTWRKIDNPPRYFGAIFKEMLSRVGVKVRGAVKVGRVPDGAEPLTRGYSPSLAVLLTDMNKVSQNFMAEQILKTLGAQTAGSPGSWPAGIEAVAAFLSELGIPKGSYVFKNGSGLNDVNRLRPRQATTLLSRMWSHFPTSAEFVASLAVAGADGSVKRRLHARSMYRRVRVKTGWLRGVSCLAGYAGGKRPVAFALFINGVRAPRAGHRAQQEVSRILAEFPEDP